MAIAAQTIHEVQSGGDDTNNGGMFDPSRTAGMFTDGAATSATGNAPVFTSASYTFVAGDVGAYVYIATGTNWTPGWYKIDSVAGGAATVNATIGTALQLTTGSSAISASEASFALNTVAGCATAASPTGATWSIDYSQQASAQFTYTDLASTGAGLTVSSAAQPFAKEQVGNSLVITGGTNFTAGRYIIASVAAGVATVTGAANITTGVGASGTGGQGGAYASPGKVGAHIVALNRIFIKSATYTVTSATINIAAGCLSISVSAVHIEGYGTVRGDLRTIGAGTRPTIIASAISTFTLLAQTVGSQRLVANIILDGAGLTSSSGVSGNNGECYNCKGQNFTNAAFSGSGMSCTACETTGCSTVASFTSSGGHFGCVAHDNTFTGFINGSYFNCVSDSNSGATSDGFGGTPIYFMANCTSYGNGRDGFRCASNSFTMANCVAEGNTGVGFTFSGTSATALNCAAYNNTGGVRTITASVNYREIGFITGTASFFTDAAGADFSLNTTAGGGAALRAIGYPGALPAGGTGYIDVGALQHADPVGGGTTHALYGARGSGFL